MRWRFFGEVGDRLVMFGDWLGWMRGDFDEGAAAANFANFHTAP
jgi:hypothetical protein